MYGIKESPPKISKPDCLKNYLQSINNEFTKIELPIQASSVEDCFRFGKYKPDAPHPKPLLIQGVKYLHSTEASMALSKIASLKAPVRITPDLTPEERQVEKLLLKERWTLGFNKKRIKLRNKCIFIDNKLYSQYQNSELCRSNYNPLLPTKPSTTQSFSNATYAPDQ